MPHSILECTTKTTTTVDVPICRCTISLFSTFDERIFLFRSSGCGLAGFLLLPFHCNNIWITIGNIGLLQCVRYTPELCGKNCDSLSYYSCTDAVELEMQSSIPIRIAYQHMRLHIADDCVSVYCVVCAICWTNKYLWVACTARFMLNYKSSGFICEQNVCRSVCECRWEVYLCDNDNVIHRRQQLETVILCEFFARQCCCCHGHRSEWSKRMTQWISFPIENRRISSHSISPSNVREIVLKQN